MKITNYNSILVILLINLALFVFGFSLATLQNSNDLYVLFLFLFIPLVNLYFSCLNIYLLITGKSKPVKETLMTLIKLILPLVLLYICTYSFLSFISDGLGEPVSTIPIQMPQEKINTNF